MPKRKRSSSSALVRQNVKRRRIVRAKRRYQRVKRRKTLPMYRTMGGQFKARKVNHRYVDRVTLAPTLGAQAIHRFRANGMYDPDQTSTGHQPMFFDQMTALYDHFVVIASKIQVNFVLNECTSGVICTLTLDDDTSTYTSNKPEAMVEGGRTAWGIGTPDDRNQIILSRSFSPKRFLGRSKPLSDPELKGSSSGDPTEQAYYVVGVESTDGATPGNIRCWVEIDYVAVWIEPKEIGQS